MTTNTRTPPRDLVLVGVPIDSLGKPGGTELAPGAIRDAGLQEALHARDAGDLPVRIVGTERDETTGIVGYPSVVTTCAGVRDGLAPLLAAGAFPVVLGGCCSLVPGVMAALRVVDDDPVGLAYVDGHLDLYTPATSPTGEAADMPVAIAIGRGDPGLVALGPSVPLVQPEHVALLAHRDTEEARGLGSLLPAAAGIDLSLDCATVQRAGAETVGAETADALADRVSRYWLSIDVDVLSTEAFPATPVRQPGGLSADELLALVRPLARHPACAGLDVLCYDVDMDDAERHGAHAVAALLAGALR